MKRFFIPIGILSIVLPLSVHALVLPGVTQHRPGQYQMLSTDKMDHRNFFEKQASSASATPTVYRSKNLNVLVSYPSNWEVTENPSTHPYLAMTPVYDGRSEKTKRMSAIMLSVRSNQNKNDLTPSQIDAYFTSHATIAPTSNDLSDWYIPSFHLISESDTTLLGHPARMYIYTGEIASETYKSVLVLSSINQHLYTLLYHSPVATFDTDQPVFDSTKASLQWLDAPAQSASSKSSRPSRRASAAKSSARSSISSRR